MTRCYNFLTSRRQPSYGEIGAQEPGAAAQFWMNRPKYELGEHSCLSVGAQRHQR